jgi:hypothetical protein
MVMKVADIFAENINRDYLKRIWKSMSAFLGGRGEAKFVVH